MQSDSLWIGRPVSRVEDERLIRGQGRFIADMNPVPGIRHAAILRSPHAHAVIRSIDINQALGKRGVVGIFTGEMIARELDPFPVGVSAPIQYYPIARSKVRYVGEPVAVVVAESRYLAEDALSDIIVQYDALPSSMDIETPGTHLDPSVLLHDGVLDNVANHRVFEYGQCGRELQIADVVLTHRFTYPRNTAVPIETYGVIAAYEPGTDYYTVWSNFHGPFTLHSVMAHALKIATHKLRLLSPGDIGGSYGVKSAVYPYAVLMAVVSRLSGCPVKWIEDRLEHMQASSSATARITDVTMGLNSQGKITALKLVQYDDVGAYIRAPEPATLYRTHGNLTGAYDIRNLTVENYAVMTNRVPTGLVRGYGGPQLYFPLERMVDIAARHFGIDPAEMRRRNFIRAGAFPYTTISGGIYDSGNYQAVLDQALETSEYDRFRGQKTAMSSRSIRYGIGMAAVVEPSGSNMGYVSLAFTPDERAKQWPKSGAAAAATVAVDLLGGITVLLDSVPEGQGHETVARQIVADVLTVPMEAVRVIAEMDTATRAWTVSSGSYSSRFASAGSSAIYGAAQKVRDKLLALAAIKLGADVSTLRLREGWIWHDHRKTVWSLKRLAGLIHWNPEELPEGIGAGVYESCYFTLPNVAAPSTDDRINSSAVYGFLVDIVKLAVDIETGHIQLLDYTTVHDAGKLLNPLLAQGQIHGGMAFGIGSALYEEMVYDERGQLLTGSLMDYLVPTAGEMPEHLNLGHHSTPTDSTPLGAKGLGEGNVMAAGAAIANALADALGVEVFNLPLTPQMVFHLVHPPHEKEVDPK
ncbi:MAG: xanthine dehydrogenase family protein molybdopterin-binding subunit [Firmicutes bacterium]|jgi:2-furoyl-CoA dehydrogenase large subunit|nr:xanthine dehydrogenase family protein molybdopterin-binding subunit [Bacillota bacterium]